MPSSEEHAHQELQALGTPAGRLNGKEQRALEILHQRCCGLDVHKRTVVACLLTTALDGTVHKQVRTFGTMTADLLALAEWLDAAACTHIAMESTGVFTPPPMLQIGGGPVKRGSKSERTDAKNHADLLFINLYPLD